MTTKQCILSLSGLRMFLSALLGNDADYYDFDRLKTRADWYTSTIVVRTRKVIQLLTHGYISK